MKIAIDETIIKEIIELLEDLAREKDDQVARGIGYSGVKESGSIVTTNSAIRMRKIARMLKEQLSSEYQQEQTRCYAEQTRAYSDCTRISSDHTRISSDHTRPRPASERR